MTDKPQPEPALLPPEPGSDGWHWLIRDRPGNPLDGIICARWMPAAGKWWLGGYESPRELARDGWRHHAPATMPEVPA